MHQRIAKTLAGLLLASAAIAGTASLAAAQEQEGTLRIAFGSFGRESLDPGSDSGVSQQQFMTQMFDQLLDFSPDGGIGPGLATEWSISPDGLLYTLKLRDDVEFHHGWGPMTAEDVRFSLIRRAAGPLGQSGAFVNLVEEIAVVDDHTVTIRLNAPAVSFLYELSPHQSTTSMILSRNYLMQGHEDMDLTALSDEDFEAEINRQTDMMNELPIGTGPFAFESRVLGDSMTFTALDSHWRKTPEFATLQFILVPEVATQVALIKSGDIDMIQVDADGAEEMDASGIPIRSMPSSTAIGWMWTGTAREAAQGKPTANAEVRRALNMAIDRETLIDVFAGGRGGLPDAPFSLTAATANVDSTFWEAWFAENVPYDLDAARKILADEGYPNGFDDEVKAFAFNRGNAPWLTQMVEAIVGGWSELGVNIEIQPIDYGAYRPHLVGAEPNDPFNAGDGAPMATNTQFDPSRSMYVWFESTGPLAVMGDSRTEFDELWKQIDSEFDPEERERLVREASLIALEHQSLTPLFNVDTLWALNPDTVDPDSWYAIEGYPYLGRTYENLRPR